MKVEARITSTWRNRMLLMAAFVFAAAGWFFYDGFIGYPKANIRSEEFARFAAEGRQAEWPAHAASKGWPRKDPGPAKSASDIALQIQLGVLLSVVGAGLLGWLGWSSTRAMRMDDEAFYDARGRRIPLGAVISVDKRKWESKGIAVARYRDGEAEGKTIIDDYKYGGAEEILKEIERRLAEKSGPAA